MSNIEKVRYVVFSPRGSILDSVKGRFGIISEDGKMRIDAEELLMDSFGSFGVLCRKNDEVFERVEQIWANGGVLVGIYQTDEGQINRGTYPLVTMLAERVKKKYPNSFDYVFISNKPEHLEKRLAWDDFATNRVTFFNLPLISDDVAYMTTLIGRKRV